MNWQKLAENRIDEAIALGEFDDLPGRGRPLDLTEYFSQPASERMGVNLLKNAGVVPPEVELLKQVAALEEALTGCGDEAKRERLNGELQERQVSLALAIERRGRREPL